jgi:hypothetical protein
MTKCNEPGDPGFNEGLAAGLLLRVALRFLADVGPGLPLVNALRDRFPGATQQQLGRWATQAADAVATAEAINSFTGPGPLPLADAPVIGGAGLWAENPMDRFQIEVEATGRDPEGAIKTFTFTIFADGDLFKSQFDESVAEYFKEKPLPEVSTDPREILELISTKVWYVTAQW